MATQNESTFKLDNGDTVYVVVNFSDWDGKFVIQRVGVKPKGKRNVRWVDVYSDYSYKRLDNNGRTEYLEAKWLEVAPRSLLNEALMSAWLALKPDIAEE